MRKTIALIFLAGAVFHWSAAGAAEDLQLNAHLNYGSNRPDGQLITGSGMEGGLVAGKANYVIIYAERSFNCKRQARRTVRLYEKYRGRVNFVVIDLDRKRSPEQRDIVQNTSKNTSRKSWSPIHGDRRSTISPAKWKSEPFLGFSMQR